MALQHLRSNTASKRPTAGAMSDGQIAVNTNATSPGLFFKDAGGAIIKVGPVHVGTTAPNSSPAGSTGNSIGEQWLDTSGGGYVLKIWDGSAWRSEVGEFVDAAGDTMTGALILPSGTAAAPALGVGSTDNGLYSPGTDQVAISTNGTGRLFVDASGRVGVGTANPTQPLEVTGGFIKNDTGTLLPTARYAGASGGAYISTNGTDNPIQFVAGTANIERLRITSAGLVGIGTSSPNSPLDIVGGTRSIQFGSSSRKLYAWSDSQGVSLLNGDSQAGDGVYINEVNSYVQLWTGSTSRIHINSSGNVGIGTTSPGSYDGNSNNLVIANTGGNAGMSIVTSSTGDGTISWADGTTGNEKYRGSIGYNHTNDKFTISTAATSAVTIDSSGRLLVGTSSNRTGSNLQLEGTTGAAAGASFVRNEAGNSGGTITLGKSRGTTNGSFTVVQNNDALGSIIFKGADGTTDISGAFIQAYVDGTPGTNDMPGRLVFSTTADGASSPTERMRITSTGEILINKTTFSDSVQYQGITLNDGGDIRATTTNATVGYFNRLGGDGELIAFYENTVKEGSISVSGTTVSYNGAHLTRWSQLSGIDPYDKTARPEILRGTVMSNLDEMCDWTCPTSGDCQDNEQLNKTKVSDVEGDKNVAGVFQSWDDDDDTWVNDFYLAITGDFVIRIAAGVTVERGDLLMSAGDGTAKPQDDDIIRSKTIAKVTSTNVSCTHPDGSYCVPCVLMAC